MTDQTVAKTSAGPLGHITPLVKTVALIVTALGAIPTAITAYYAWHYKVPFGQVAHRLDQYDILVRNLDCRIDYKALSTTQGTRVDVGACPKTRDISLKVSSPDGAATYEWIAYNQLQKPGEAPPSGILDLLFGIAHAESSGSSGAHIQLAQAGMEVVCQSIVGPTQLVRVVKEGGKCFRETMSPVRSTVDKREEVPCDTQCR
jgi:hypothetical protein